jgi:hypothetical protein
VRIQARDLELSRVPASAGLEANDCANFPRGLLQDAGASGARLGCGCVELDGGDEWEALRRPSSTGWAGTPCILIPHRLYCLDKRLQEYKSYSLINVDAKYMHEDNEEQLA